MAHTLMTCRICHRIGCDPKCFVKYSVRHYAHHACYLEAGKPLEVLSDWQMKQFPYRLLEKHGVDVKAMLEK